ncbi:ornithine cyclodeaminase [uncultured Psychrobacter sp.]|uniref:ornithine cyclodeaminase n=1 Tax=uncultured Psychrobacter sp. TaxID=259303 RepID=UPI00262DD7D5|nr:ornithine cyclodeaminase [uncultured Psychrobacter sp.]
MSKFILPPKEGVPFVSVQAMAKMIHDYGVEQCIADLVDALEQDFLRWEQFEKSSRFASHSKDGVIELMPVSDGEMFACKYVNGHPINTKRDLQTVAAMGILSDVDTGYPILLTEMCILTALRTAATSAMLAKRCAPKGAKTLALIGNGAQSEFQALGMKAVVGISEVRLYDVDSTASQKTADNLADSGLNVVICRTVEDAVAGADIITTCTADKKNATILRDGNVKKGIFINAIGGDCPGKTELDGNILMRADRVIVEFEPQSRIEGEIQQLSPEFPVIEFHHILKGEVSARESDDDLVIFDGVGFASEDFTALVFLRDLIREQGEYEVLDMITQQADPKNLYSVVKDHSVTPTIAIA